MHELAYMLSYGDGIEKDAKEGAKYMNMTTDNGDNDSSYTYDLTNYYN